MNTPTAIVIFVAIVALLVYIFRGTKRPKPQQPPSDRERFQAIKRDWEQKP